VRAKVAQAINNDVISTWNGHASVGALAQTYLYLALSDYGYGDTAFNISIGYSTIDSQWERQVDTIIWRFTVPSNTSALLDLAGPYTQYSGKYKAGRYLKTFKLKCNDYK
jgi:hypothetical protein